MLLAIIMELISALIFERACLPASEISVIVFFSRPVLCIGFGEDLRSLRLGLLHDLGRIGLRFGHQTFRLGTAFLQSERPARRAAIFSQS